MAFELHPIIDKDVSPRPGLWYAVATESGAAPAARVGATAIQAREAGCVLMCAGAAPDKGVFSDLHKLKIDSGCISWQSLPSNFLPPRYEHTMVITPDGQPLVYAGAHENGPIQDMWKYNQANGEWCEVSVIGDPPSPRTHHSSTCVWRDKLVVFSGGESGTNTLDSAIHLFDMVSLTWCTPKTTGSPPPPRQGHISVVVGDTLYIHGGMMSSGGIYDDLYTLNLDTMHWCQPHVSGMTLPPLAAHGCTVINTSVYIFGGLSTNGASNTLYCLDTDAMSWSVIVVVGPAPPCRLDHAMTTITLSHKHSLSSKLTHSDKLSSPSTQDTPITVPNTTTSSTTLSSHSSPGSHQAQITTTPPNLITVMAPDLQMHFDKNAKEGTNSCNAVTETQTFGGVNDSKQEMTSFKKSPDTAGEGGDIEAEVCSTARDGGSKVANESVLSLDGDLDKGGSCHGSHCENDSKKTAKIDDKSLTSVPQSSEVVIALFIFGGMDTDGHIHDDCFLIVPPK